MGMVDDVLGAGERGAGNVTAAVGGYLRAIDQRDPPRRPIMDRGGQRL